MSVLKKSLMNQIIVICDLLGDVAEDVKTLEGLTTLQIVAKKLTNVTEGIDLMDYELHDCHLSPHDGCKTCEEFSERYYKLMKTLKKYE